MSHSKVFKTLLFLPIILFFAVPLLSALLIIFIEATDHRLSCGYLLREIQSDYFLTSFQFSFYLASISTLISCLMGFGIALLLLQYQESNLLHRLIKWPILFPHFTVALMMFLLFGQSGFVSRWLAPILGYVEPSQFPAMVFDAGGLGIILSYVWKEVPFAAVMCYTHLVLIHRLYSDLGLILCRGPLDYVRRVLLPLSKPILVSVFALLFSYNFGAFEIPLLIGPTWPRTMAVQSFILYQSPDLAARPSAMALNLLITLFSSCLLWLNLKALEESRSLEANR